MQYEKHWYSSIRSSLKKETLVWGTSLAGGGIFVLALAGMLLPVSSLQQWGWLIFLVSILSIAASLIPYRRLCTLEQHPYILSIDLSSLHVEKEGTLLFEVPLSCVARIGYATEQPHYGIALWIQEGIQGGIQKNGQKIASPFPTPPQKIEALGCHLFLPYFSERTFRELTDFYTPA